MKRKVADGEGMRSVFFAFHAYRRLMGAHTLPCGVRAWSRTLR